MPSGNWTTTEIGTAGERAVVAALKSDGWVGTWDTKGAGSTDVEAKKGSRHVLIQVKAALEGTTPAQLSSDELRNIKSRAAKLGAEAWLAQVTLSKANLSRVGDIAWTKL